MTNAASTGDFKRWKVDVLRKYCQQGGLTTASSTGKRKEESVVLAYVSHVQNLPMIASKDEEKSSASAP